MAEENSNPETDFAFVFDEMEDPNLRLIIDRLLSDLTLVVTMQERLGTKMDELKEIVMTEVKDPNMYGMPVAIAIEKLLDRLEDNELYHEKIEATYSKSLRATLRYMQKLQIPEEETPEEEISQPEETSEEEEPYEEETPAEADVPEEEAQPEEELKKIVDQDDMLELQKRYEDERIENTVPEMKSTIKKAMERGKKNDSKH